MNSDALDPFLRLPAVLECTGLSRATLYRMMKAGTFPPQHRIGDRCCAWRRSEVAVWLRDPKAFRADALTLASATT